MFSDNRSVGKYKITGSDLCIRIFFYIRSIISVRYKTDILTVRFMSDQKTDLICHRTDLVLGIFSDRHQCPGKLFLCKVVKCICLIFCRSCRIADRISSVRKFLYSSVMPGRNVFRTDIKAPLQKRLPFYIAVAGNARVWCSSMQIVIDKIIDHIFFKFFLKIHDIIRDFKCCRHSSCIIHRAQTTTAAMFFHRGFFFILPDLHRNSYYIISLIF